MPVDNGLLYIVSIFFVIMFVVLSSYLTCETNERELKRRVLNELF